MLSSLVQQSLIDNSRTSRFSNTIARVYLTVVPRSTCTDLVDQNDSKVIAPRFFKSTQNVATAPPSCIYTDSLGDGVALHPGTHPSREGWKVNDSSNSIDSCIFGRRWRWHLLKLEALVLDLECKSASDTAKEDWRPVVHQADTRGFRFPIARGSIQGLLKSQIVIIWYLILLLLCKKCITAGLYSSTALAIGHWPSQSKPPQQNGWSFASQLDIELKKPRVFFWRI